MMDEKINPQIAALLAYVKKRGGHLVVKKLLSGNVSFVYWYYEDGVKKRLHFPSNVHLEDIKVRVMQIQEAIDYKKAGMGSMLADRRRKDSKTTITDLVKWFIEISLIERVPAKHEFREFKEESTKNTLIAYEYASNKLRKFFSETEANENFFVENLTIQHVNNFKRWLIKSNISPRLGNNILRQLRKMFKKARYENKTIVTVFDEIEFIPEHRSTDKRSLLTLSEMRDISESDYVQKKPELWLAWQLARFMGMRGADILRLKREWIDLEKETIKIYVAKRKGEIIERPMHRGLIKYLREYFEKHKVKPNGKLFHSSNLNLTLWFNYSIKRVLPDAKFAGSHAPRHSLAAYLRNEAEWDAQWIGFFLGHTGKDVTSVYTHEHLEKLRKMLNKLPLDGGE